MNRDLRISFLLKMITDRVDTMITRELTLERVTAAQGRVLTYLISRDGELVSQKDVEQYFGISHTTVKGIVSRLEEKDLVKTAFDNEDGRVKNIYLTERSHMIHQSIGEQIAAIEDTLLRGVSLEDRALMKVLLQRMYNNIK